MRMQMVTSINNNNNNIDSYNQNAIIPAENLHSEGEVHCDDRTSRKTMVSMTAPCHANKKYLVFTIPIGNTMSSIPLIPSIAPCEANDGTCARQDQFRNFLRRLQVT